MGGEDCVACCYSWSVCFSLTSILYGEDSTRWYLQSPFSKVEPKASLPSLIAFMTWPPRLSDFSSGSSLLLPAMHFQVDFLRRVFANHCSYASCEFWNSRSISQSTKDMLCESFQDAVNMVGIPRSVGECSQSLDLKWCTQKRR